MTIFLNLFQVFQGFRKSKLWDHNTANAMSIVEIQHNAIFFSLSSAISQTKGNNRKIMFQTNYL